MELRKSMAVEIHIEHLAYSTKSDIRFAWAFGPGEQALRRALLMTFILTSLNYQSISAF